MYKDADFGEYFWRGGKKINVEKEEEFFTALVKDESELERMLSLSGVSEVKPVHNRIFKVQVSRDHRDAAMESFRSEDMAGVCHHAYRPRGATNTRYYITDQIVAKFGQDVARESIEKILFEAGVRIVRDYPGSPNTFLLLVTAAAGRNPIKVANGN